MTTQFKFIRGENTDPYFNLASEEYLLKHTDGYYIYLWINSPAVIVGVNQNALQEVNLSYTEENGVKVVRRLTGGGAVYHDVGNICYTVIAPYNSEENNYVKFTAPVISYLNSLGVNAKFSGRNDITIDDKKISGNAQTIYGNRIMHHGTLLFDTKPDNLEKSLKPNKLKMQSKGIKSIRARVTNIKDYLSSEMTASEFFVGLCDFFSKDSKEYAFTTTDIQKIQSLVDKKYSTYEWNIGNSPKGQNTFEHKFSYGIVTLNFDSVNGLISNPTLTGDFFEKKDVKALCEKLNGTKLEKQSVENALKDIGDYIVGASAKEFVEKMFE